MVVLPQHHDHEVWIETDDDPAHRVRPVEVVGPREAGGDPTLARHLDEPWTEDTLREVAETCSEGVSDDHHPEPPAGRRRPDGICLGRRAVPIAVLAAVAPVA